MTMTVTLPDHLVERLIKEAEARQMPVETLVTDLLTDALDNIELVIARIKALSPSIPTLYPGHTEPTRALQNIGNEPPVDVEEWNRQWAAVEATMREADRLDELRDLYSAES